MVNPFLINDADFKEDLLSMRMLLSQHGEKDEGIQPTED
jgi:hypothetical protein